MNRNTHLTVLVLFLTAGVLTLAGWSSIDDKPQFHSDEDLAMYRSMAGELPSGENDLFAASGNCAGCHGHDIQATGNVTESGWDVNPTDYWRSSIMANSAKDPFWQAKVTHEVAVNPDHQLLIEDKCTSCHAPLGHYNAHYTGAAHYTFAEMLEDSIALDGVSCNACHQQAPAGLGDSFSGELSFSVDTVWGPFGGGEGEDPIIGQPMAAFVGFEPLFGEHVRTSEMCAGCHTLITETVDLEGELTGGKFVEQATYHEWLNSAFAEEGNTLEAECQACHMPKLDEEVLISANYSWLPARGPIGLHYMVGGNSFMLEMMKNNIDLLGIDATEAQFDTSIYHTLDMLQNQTALLSVEEGTIVNDSMEFSVRIENLAGHKFPSGYPARRAFVEFVATDEAGDTLFHSGELQEDYEVFGHDETFEPHYNVITDEDQVQIYEQVLGDVNGDVTTVLIRAATPLKDNRIVPKGFSMSHSVYDTTQIAGLALDDTDFNYEGGIEGSGTDELMYRIPLDGYEGNIDIQVRLWYQSSPPKWNEEMFAYSTPEIDLFKDLYFEQGAVPVLIDESDISVSAVYVERHKAPAAVKLYPNPTYDGRVFFESTSALPERVEVFSLTGQLLSSVNGEAIRNGIQLPDLPGSYLIAIYDQGKVYTEKVIRL